MGLLKRFTNVFRAEFNEMLDNVEDPAKLAALNLTDAKEEYLKLREKSVDVVANAIDTEKRYKELSAEADKYHAVAKNALKVGNEDDAKRALEKENRLRADAEDMKQTYLSAKQDADRVKASLEKLKEKIDDAEDSARRIKAKTTTAEIKEAAASIDFGKTSGLLDSIAKAEEKADKKLARAAARETMQEAEDAIENDGKDLLEKYSVRDSGVDDALEALRQEIQ